MDKIIETERLFLRQLNEESYKEVLSFLVKGRQDFEKYEAKKNPGYYTETYQKMVLSQESQAMDRGVYIRYYAFLKDDISSVIGTVSCGGIKGEPYMSGTIGYKFDRDFQGKGYATEAVLALVGNIFRKNFLHRINGYVMEENKASIRLLERCGFQMEGVCRKILRVNGVWQDHRLYSILNESQQV